MKFQIHRWSGLVSTGLLVMSLTPLLAHDESSRTNAGYSTVSLVSDLPNLAVYRDARLKNPWGIVAGEEAVWVNDNGSGLTTVYTPWGQPYTFQINIPTPSRRSGGTPTGLVFNDTSAFVISNSQRRALSTFLMATEDGTIVAWNNTITGSNAVIVVNNSSAGAVYKGLAIARTTNGAPQLYAANFRAGLVEVYNAQFRFLASFTDPDLPANFAPFGIRTLFGRVFVTFALQNLPDARDDQAGPGNGFVDIFDTDGTLLRRFASQGPLNSPWGLAVAPDPFGKFSNALLVGNFGDGMVNAYDLLTGKFLGNLTFANGQALAIRGLWGLTFVHGDPRHYWGGDEGTRLYFTAGIKAEADGLFGYIRPVNPWFPAAR